jgi:hypothetical protein
MRQREEAERLARFAATRGHEAVILECATLERLDEVARAVVERQDMRQLPALRYLPTAEALLSQEAQDQLDRDIAAGLLGERETGAVAESLGDLSASEADQRRLALEDGPGGDVTASATTQHAHLAFPTRKDVLRAWLRLWARAAAGDVGGPDDGARRA